MLKKYLFKRDQTVLWLLVWFAIALSIRLTNLDAAAPWMDEVATVLFSLGNASSMIPLGEIISLEQLLRPLHITPGSTPTDVVTNLLTEDNHPPTYFVLAHAWMKLFPRPDGYASVWGARSLSALFGALGSPAVYLLAWATFHDGKASPKDTRTIGIFCAALIAVSPLDVFLSQEARHYTLAILLVIASLTCFALAARTLVRDNLQDKGQQQTLSWAATLIWIAINALGMSVHYFFGLTLVAEALTLLILLIRQCLIDVSAWRQPRWIKIYLAVVGTIASVVVWLPILLNFYGSPQSSFLRSAPSSWQHWVNPVVQSLAGWLYVLLSPITNGAGWRGITAIAISCFLLLVYTIWLTGRLRQAWRFQLRQSSSKRAGILAMGGFFIVSNVLFLLICYGLGFDITRGHRYSFVFFPSLLVLVGAALAPYWESKFDGVKLPYSQRIISGRTLVVIVICVGFLGSQVMINNLSSLKFYKADQFVDLIHSESIYPIVLGTDTTITQKPLVVGIEIMSVGWEIKRQLDRRDMTGYWPALPRFVIAENNVAKGLESIPQLKQSLSTVERPFDLWLLNMTPNLADNHCTTPENGNQSSFSYAHYVCSSL